MADLDEYDAKRDFTGTSEPAPGGPRPDADGAPRFVVQEHHASTLHWDLRLEHDGVLASWALPRGFPDTPEHNRLAVHTEDHPLEYLEFHGDIPEGHYGAGSMEIWDRGTYEAHSWADDKVVLTFHGERVRGRHALFRTGTGSRWMIHRMDPPPPGREPLPAGLVPMLATAGELPARDEGWAYEVKWDGVRALAYLEPGRLRLESRNLLDITAQYPELRGLIEAVGAHDAVLDGEIVAFDEDGRPSFERLQQRMHHTSEATIRRRAADHPVTYVLFDLLFLDGEPLMELPYDERRARLEALRLDGPHWQTPARALSDGRGLLEATAAQGLEGLVAKRRDSVYLPGRRSRSWIKVKNARRQEFVVGGWTPGKGGRAGDLGALLVGTYDGDALRYAGRVGTGMGARERRLLLDRLEPLARTGSPFAPGAATPPPRDARFTDPELVVEVEFHHWTTAGMLRHPTYRGLRTDKGAREVTREDTPKQDGVPAPPGSWTSADVTRGNVEIDLDDRPLRLTNLDKVLYPRDGFTKGQLIDYYARIAPVLVPHLRGRPLTLKRFPNGVDEKAFFQKHAAKDRPDWMTTTLVDASTKGPIEELVVDSRAGLVWTANRAAIELHTLLAPADAPEHPDALVFDLDPGAPADVIDSAQVAVWIRGMLDELGLRTLVKTSGSKGLQLYVPLRGTATHEQTKAFALAVAQTLADRFPDRVVSRMARAQRPGKVFIDWSQNDAHKTTVNVYSVRAREHPTVSTPVTWAEVQDALEAADAGRLVFTTEQVLERVARDGDLFADLLRVRQELPGTG